MQQVLTGFYTRNIMGLYPKTNQCKVPLLQELALQNKYAFIALTETHLHEDVFDAEISIKNYVIYRADRMGRSHGGVAVYLEQRLAVSARVLTSFSNGTTELVVVYVGSLNLVIANCYRPPRTRFDTFEQALNILIGILENLPNQQTEVLILGDFNFPTIDWRALIVGVGVAADERNQAQRLMDMIESNFLTQFVLEPTRSKNILDLIISNSHGIMHSYKVFETAMSDHNMIEAYVNINALTAAHPVSADNRNFPVLGQLNFHDEKIDWDKLRSDFAGMDWEEMFADCDCDATLDVFIGCLSRLCERSIPKSKKKTNKRLIPRDRRVLMRRRAVIRGRLESHVDGKTTDKLNTEMIDIENKLLASHMAERGSEEEKAVDNIKINSKYFFSYANRKIKNVSQIGPLLNEHGELEDDIEKMAQILRLQYEGVFSAPDVNMVIRDPDDHFSLRLDPLVQRIMDVEVTVEDVLGAIDSIAPSAAPGPDGISAVLLKNCKKELALPLRKFYNMSLKDGYVPAALKMGIITPIHKGGSRGAAKNYRPVTLTTHLIKILERIIRAKLVKHMNDIGAFNDGQHGFRGGRSCLSQLLVHYERITDEVGTGNNVDVIYLDFEKAFDKVDHGILLHKVRDLGIIGKLGRWLYNFLTGRKQKVSVRGYLSEESEVVSGVPQGSVLGPLLFLIMIADIDSDLQNSRATSFADDTRISRRIATEDDVLLLQGDLDNVLHWAVSNNMNLNGEKFELLRYGPK
jgi:exonuclease III